MWRTSARATSSAWQRVRATLGRAPPRAVNGHLAVIDADRGSRPRPHEGNIIQAVAALQVHDLRGGAQYLLQKGTLHVGQRGSGRRLRQEVTVLADVLLR
jgi:hypothetical protein